MQSAAVVIMAALASGAALLFCAVLWAWLVTLPAGRLTLLSALVVLSIGGLWLAAG